MPEHSVVLQVRATELVRSAGFGTSYTLRFPRVVRVRDDKPYDQVMTLDEFNCLTADKGSVVKIANKKVNQDQIVGTECSTRRKRTAKVLQVAEQFRARAAPGRGAVAVRSSALSGRQLCVLSDDERSTRQDLVDVLESHGGKHVENPGPDTWCCIAGRLTYRVRVHIDSHNVNVATAAWLRSLPQSHEPCALSPLDMLAITRHTRLALCREYDTFGDSYRELVDEDTLRKCFSKMDRDEPDYFLLKQEMLDIDKELYGGSSPHSFLRPCYIHLMNTNDLSEIKAKMYGATICDLTSPCLTHIVVPKGTDVTEIEAVRKNVRAFVISEDWLEKCFSEQKFIPETRFLY